MPDLSHLWQRFVLAATLVFGLAVGIAATIFGYSNQSTVSVGFAVWHVNGVPLWTVAIVPLAVALVVGTLYHWWNSLHHFTEHMRHRRRVRDLESELASLKEHLDHLLEMPEGAATPKPSPVSVETEEAPTEEVLMTAPAPVEVTSTNGAERSAKPASNRKRAATKAASEAKPAAVSTHGDNGAPSSDTAEEANS